MMISRSLFKSKPASRVSFLLLLLSLLSLQVAIAQSITVAPGAVDVNPGDGTCSLREAIANANSDSDTSAGDCLSGSGPDTIELSPGSVYTLRDVADDTFGDTGLPSITSEITLLGHGATIQRAHLFVAIRIMHVSDTGNLSLDDVTITRGSEAATGGPHDTFRGIGAGILNEGTLSLRNSTITRQLSPRAGRAVYNSGDLEVVNSTFADNRRQSGTGDGGAIYNTGTATIAGSTFIGNVGGNHGGAIYSDGTLTVTDTHFEKNIPGVISSRASGGAIFNDGTATISASTFVDNIAQNAGAAIFNNRSLDLSDVTMTRNGGGNDVIWNDETGHVTATNLVISESSDISPISNFNGSIRIDVCLIANNSRDISNNGQLHMNRCTVLDDGIISRGTLIVTNSTLDLGHNRGGASPENSFEFVRGQVQINSSTIAPFVESARPGIVIEDAQVSIKNSIVSASCHFRTAGSGSITSLGHNVVTDEACFSLTSSDILVEEDDIFAQVVAPLADNGGPTPTHALLPGSPAIDAGSCFDLQGDPISSDQRGEHRPSNDPDASNADGGCDIGAFELQFAPPMADNTPPVCGRINTFKDSQGRLFAVQTSAGDEESGILSVEFTRLSNLNGFLDGAGPFAEGHVEQFDPQTTPDVLIRGERVDMEQGGAMVTRITNGAGLTAMCDPVLSTLTAEIPMEYNLEQNFPNPFNPETTIRFSLPEPVHVRLVVYDVSGQEVARLVDGPVSAGVHEARFFADDLSSGVFFVRLEAGSYSATRRIILLK